MTMPKITPLPPPPLPTDAEAIFDQKAGVSLTAQVAMVPEINAAIAWWNSQVIAPGLPDVTGKSGALTTDGQSVSWNEVGQKVGDVLVTARYPDSTYLRTGTVYLQSAYPALFSVVGLIGTVFLATWSAVTAQSAGKAFGNAATDRKGLWFASANDLNLGPIISKSVDNGATWTSVSIAGFVAADQPARFLTDEKGVWNLICSSGRVFSSRDNGGSWSAPRLTGVNQSLAVATDKMSTIIIAGNNQAPYRSLDNGLTWSPVTIFGVGGSLLAVAYAGNGVWIGTSSIAGSTILYRSTDNGATWRVQYSDNSSTFQPRTCASDSKGNCIAAGIGGRIWRSADAGATWLSVIITDTANILVTSEIDDLGYCVVGGASGVCYKSTNFGASWEAVPTGIAASAQVSVVKSDGRGTWNVFSTAGSISRSVPSFSYDTATQFITPAVTAGMGSFSYIKGRDIA